MKKAVILLTIIFIGIIQLNLIKAANTNLSLTPDIVLNYPSEVRVGEEFNAGLILNNFPEDVYDVRIGILNNGTRVSRIWNGSYWQSSYFYVNNIINTSQADSQTFRLNITSCFNGIGDIDIKLKDSKSKYYTFLNYTLKVNASCSSFNIINNTNSINNPVNNNSSEISLKLSTDSYEIKYGKEFEISVRAFNLEDKNYDAKVYVFNDEDKIISQVYDEDKWLSSNNYIDELFKGPGDKSKTLKLRIKEQYKDFNGEATLGIRLREHGSSTYKIELQDSIEVLKRDSSEENTSEKTNQDALLEEKKDKNTEISNEDILEERVIYLGSSKLKSEGIKSKKNTIYQSENELIKRYSVYGFIALILILVALIGFGFYKNRMIKDE